MKRLFLSAVTFGWLLSSVAMVDDATALDLARARLTQLTPAERTNVIAQVNLLCDWPKEITSSLPGLSALAQTWDPAWARAHGEALGVNLRARGIDVAPAICLNDGCFGEDPCLISRLCVPLLQGLQSRDVAATLSDFRFDSQTQDVRALNEIHLSAFRSAVKEGESLCVVTGDNAYLNQGILRDRWGFKGMTQVDGEEEKTLRALFVLAKIGLLTTAPRKAGALDLEANQSLARAEAADSIVLLKNNRRALPLLEKDLTRVLVVDASADNERFGAHLLYEALTNRLGSAAVEIRACVPTEELKRAAEGAESVLVYTGPEAGSSDFPAAIQTAIRTVLGWKLRKGVVVSRSEAPIDYSWLDLAETFVHTANLGAAESEALVDVLLGVVNPSGRLSCAWPTISAEGIFIGYRWYDHRGISPRFAFGAGLSYTTFEWSNARIGQGFGPRNRDAFEILVDVTNTGDRPGRDVVEVYLGYPEAQLERCVKDLRGFAKTKVLSPGETQTLSIILEARDFAYWDSFENRFRADKGEYEVLLSSSSSAKDIRASATVRVTHDQRFRD